MGGTLAKLALTAAFVASAFVLVAGQAQVVSVDLDAVNDRITALLEDGKVDAALGLAEATASAIEDGRWSKDPAAGSFFASHADLYHQTGKLDAARRQYQ